MSLCSIGMAREIRNFAETYLEALYFVYLITVEQSVFNITTVMQEIKVLYVFVACRPIVPHIK